MKAWTARSLPLTILFFASPALAQNDQVAQTGAGALSWIVVGLIGGYLASRVVNRSGEGVLRDILLGILGGVVAGILLRAFGGQGVTGINIWSIVVAFIGSVAVLVIYHAVRGQRAT